MKNFIQPGDNLDLIAPRALNSGDGFLVGSIFAVASVTAAIGATLVGVTRGVFALPKAVGAVTQGQKLYWDDTAHMVTTSAGGNTQIGVATAAAAAGSVAGDTTVATKLGYVA